MGSGGWTWDSLLLQERSPGCPTQAVGGHLSAGQSAFVSGRRDKLLNMGAPFSAGSYTWSIWTLLRPLALLITVIQHLVETM